MANRWETMEIVIDLILGGSEITADGDCSHEIKRWLLHERKAMTNLDSILKSRDITLLVKIWMVKAMFFQWSYKDVRVGLIEKTKCWRIDAFEQWCWRRLLRVPWTARRSNQSVLKEVNPEYSLEGLMLKLKLQTLATWYKDLTHLKIPWCWERLKVEGEGENSGWDGWMPSSTQWT